MKRIFLALNLPLNIKQGIFALYNQDKNPNIKWTNLDNLHITLKFIGGVEEGDLQKLKTFLTANLKIPSIDLKIQDTIFFPKYGPPKIIALQGILEQKTNQQINRFLKLLSLELKFIPLDQHQFTPHITIARVKKFINKIDFQFDYQNNCQINTVDLMESILTPTGPIYQIITSY